MRSRLAGILILAVAGLSLALVWRLIPPSSPPLYDGITVVPPYKYVHRPPGLGPEHANPTSARQTVRVHKTSPELYLATKESAPQALLALAQGALRIPPGVTRITFSIQPVPPPAPLAPAVLDGNVYLFQARANNGSTVTVKPGVGARIELRKTGAEANAVVEQYANGGWQRRQTLSFVNASYLATNATSLGWYALVFPNKAAASSSNSLLPLVIIGIAIIVLVVIGLIALRVVRARNFVEEG